MSYDPKHLVRDLTKDVAKASGLEYQDGITIDLNLQLGTITFKRVKALDKFQDNILKSLSKSWTGKVFLGTTGYFAFGNVLNQGKLVRETDGPIGVNIFIITVPFRKLDKYESYLLIDEDILGIIISKLAYDFDFRALTGPLGAYPQLRSLNIYPTLVKEKVPFLFNDIVQVLANANPEDKETYDWWIIYHDILKYTTSELVLTWTGYEIKTLGRSRYTSLVAAILTKRNYPGLYGKLKDINSFKDFYDDYVSFDNIRKKSPLVKYSQTGQIPQGFVFEYKLISSRGDNGTIVALMMRDGVNFSSFEDLYKTIVHQGSLVASEYERRKPEFLRFLKLSGISPDTLMQILAVPIPTGSETYYTKATYNLIKEYLGLPFVADPDEL